LLREITKDAIMKKRRRFTKEFKHEAVQYYRKSGLSCEMASKELGTSSTSLSRWTEQADIDEGNNPKGELTTMERKEIRELRRENRRLKMEAEILKKAAFFAGDQF